MMTLVDSIKPKIYPKWLEFNVIFNIKPILVAYVSIELTLRS